MKLKLIVLLVLSIAMIGCTTQQETLIEQKPGLSKVEQLTFEGDNGEAYWGPQGQQIIFQSNTYL